MSWLKPKITEETSSGKFKLPAIPLNIPTILAEKQARKIHGRGVTIDSNHSEVVDYLNEFFRLNRMHEQLIVMEEICAEWGQTVSCLNPILPGEKVPRWNYADPRMMSRVEKMHITETSGTVYKYIVKDTRTWPVIETWTEKTVKRQYYQDVSQVDTGYGPRYDLTKLHGLRPITTEEVTHNLGCMPIDEIRNKTKIHLSLFRCLELEIWTSYLIPSRRIN